MRGLISAAVLMLSLDAMANRVGMGHMVREGVTYGANKGFYIAIINESNATRTFDVLAYEADMSTPATDVRLQRRTLRVAAHRSVRMLSVVTELTPSQPKTRFVCIYEENHENARICTRLIAHRSVGH